MGNNAVVVVLLDRLHEIKNDPQFGQKLVDAILHRADGYPGENPYVTGQTQCISVAHADSMQIVAVGGNTGRVLAYGHYRDLDEALVREVARKNGIAVRHKRNPQS